MDQQKTTERPSVTTTPSATTPTESDGSKGQRTKVFGAIFAILVAGAFGFLGGWLGAESRSSGALNQGVSTSRQIVTSEGELINQIAEEVGPSVVSVNVVSQGEVSGFFGEGRIIEQQSAGTGFIISEDGYVATNRHVIPEGTTDVTVTLSDGTELENVEVVGRTQEGDSLDIAFLKIQDAEGKDLKVAKLGNSSDVEVGDRVVAIGNALGQFQNTVTSGIISGYGRSVQASDGSGAAAENLHDLFQTDAAINQGNSGGPLVNMNGEVIGVNTAVAGNAQNIGFAIPVNDIKGLAEQVTANGEFQRPYLGVRYIPLNGELAEQFELDTETGAYVAPSEESGQPSVLPGSPAEAAGLAEGDVIIAIEGRKIGERQSVTSLLNEYTPGDTVSLKVLRDGKEVTLEAELGEMPRN